jgi:ABC-type lipoprotein release transport system permease subunit
LYARFFEELDRTSESLAFILMLVLICAFFPIISSGAPAAHPAA